MAPRTKAYWIERGLAFFYQTGDWPKCRDFGTNGSLIKLFGKWSNFVDACKLQYLEGRPDLSEETKPEQRPFVLQPEEREPAPELPPVIEIHVPTGKNEHLFIPDLQHRLGLPTDHLTAVGNYACERQPSVIVFAGDIADFTSLSSYDTAARKTRLAVSVEQDFMAYHEAIDAVLDPIKARKDYKPRVVITLGNHDGYVGARRERYADNHPEWQDSVAWGRTLRVDAEVYEFLVPIAIDGIAYCHYFNVNSNGMVTASGRGQASARAQVQNVGVSCTAGHKQGLDVHIKECQGGRKRGLIAGSFYQHNEDYLTPQGNTHWRGCIYKHDVHNGDYDLMELSLGYLLSKWV